MKRFVGFYNRCRFKFCLCAVLSLIGLLVLSSSAFALQYGDFTCTVSGGTVTITGYTGSGGAVVIPATIDGMPVMSIWYGTFSGCSSLTNLTIPDSVKFIGSLAFYNCSGLTSVTIGKSVIFIGSSAFDSCSSLTSVTIPDSVTYIGGRAFWSCESLTSVTIGKSVKSIDYGAFKGCKRLNRAYFLGNAPLMVMRFKAWLYGFSYYVRDGVFDKCALNFTICYTAGSTGFTFPIWYGYPAGLCPCATEAIYGENAEETELLRAYRDRVLSKTPEGQEIIETYYKYSPIVTKLLVGKPVLKNKAKSIIDSILPGIRKRVDECKRE